MKKQKHIISDLETAFIRLKEAVLCAKTELEIDGVIQRFEFTFELSWKTMKTYLEEEGIESKSPRMAIKESYSFGLIKNEKVWLNMLSDRNLASHTYNKQIPKKIFARIKNLYTKEIEKLLKSIKKLRYE